MKVKVEPISFVYLIRILCLLFLSTLWVVNDQWNNGFILIFILAILAGLRWRFKIPFWLSFVDLVCCLLFLPIWSGSIYGIALSLFDGMVRGRFYSLFLIPVGVILASVHEVFLFWYLLNVGVIGAILYYWKKSYDQTILEADEERLARYELEKVKAELLEANSQAVQMAEVSERYRIARDLHDHLGHDLTGAVLGLQTFRRLEKGREKEAILDQVQERIERSTTTLRETVHDLTPVARLGAEQLAFIANNYLGNEVEVEFNQSGNMNVVPVQIWSLLEPCMKEVLTNIARHSNATKVIIHLDVTEMIVRLSVRDNGFVLDKEDHGTGLRHLKARARAAGGSISVNVADGYLVVCVFPIHEGRGELNEDRHC
ncbi:sensor histidine kinase [Halalkalibacter sp. APA_J-10(15)]|uniref:sensor histidine kinase n=1 Tax=Halalkalibacter sp. APA_J-10(15) TaxID=2933805 RepID=UPI001FF4EBA7|nr:sensor histidine kinase [Halalkalibacter sp. APA_J-10(15)]MCK0471755.1 sensor histidine kinase [Halalkalibacter sp. APA_J-10(15)]